MWSSEDVHTVSWEFEMGDDEGSFQPKTILWSSDQYTCSEVILSIWRAIDLPLFDSVQLSFSDF